MVTIRLQPTASESWGESGRGGAFLSHPRCAHEDRCGNQENQGRPEYAQEIGTTAVSIGVLGDVPFRCLEKCDRRYNEARQ